MPRNPSPSSPKTLRFFLRQQPFVLVQLSSCKIPFSSFKHHKSIPFHISSMERPENLTVAVHKLEAILDPCLQREILPCTARDIHNTISKMSLADTDLPTNQSWLELQALVQKLEKWCHAEEPLLSRDEFSCFIWVSRIPTQFHTKAHIYRVR